MGFLDLFKQNLSSSAAGAPAAILSSAVDFGFQALGNAVLPMSKAQRQMNEYNSAEAQKARDFSAQEAEMNREWQEEQMAKYNSLQGKISQAKQAGVNPMHVVTGSSVSPSSASPVQPAAPAASGSSASPIGQISDMAAAALGFGKLGAEIKNINAQTRNMNAQALKTELESAWVDRLNAQTISESVKRIEVADVDIQFKNQQISELASRILVNDATVQEKMQNVSLLASQTALTSQNTRNAAEQFKLISAQVLNTNEDTHVKHAMIAQILAQTDSENLLHAVYKCQPALIKAQTSESRMRYNQIQREIRILEQQYGHDKIMNGFKEYAASLEKTTIEDHNPQDLLSRSLKFLIESFVEVLSLGGYTSFNTSNTTVTTVDGNPPITHKRVGF